MGLGSLFKSLFGGGGDQNTGSVASAEAVEYNGFLILPEPIKEGGQYRTAGRISKEIDGETRESRFIRADNNGDLNSAVDHCIYKGKQIIDEQGESLLSRDMV